MYYCYSEHILLLHILDIRFLRTLNNKYTIYDVFKLTKPFVRGLCGYSSKVVEFVVFIIRQFWWGFDLIMFTCCVLGVTDGILLV